MATEEQDFQTGAALLAQMSCSGDDLARQQTGGSKEFWGKGQRFCLQRETVLMSPANLIILFSDVFIAE